MAADIGSSFLHDRLPRVGERFLPVSGMWSAFARSVVETQSIAVPPASLVYAVWTGRVVSVGPGGSGEVVIRGTDEMTAHYWRMLPSSVQVSKGDRVTAGDVIGVVGDAGDDLGFEFGIQDRDGEWLDVAAALCGATDPDELMRSPAVVRGEAAGWSGSPRTRSAGRRERRGLSATRPGSAVERRPRADSEPVADIATETPASSGDTPSVDPQPMPATDPELVVDGRQDASPANPLAASRRWRKGAPESIGGPSEAPDEELSESSGAPPHDAPESGPDAEPMTAPETAADPESDTESGRAVSRLAARRKRS